jgi:hypothetical protein
VREGKSQDHAHCPGGLRGRLAQPKQRRRRSQKHQGGNAHSYEPGGIDHGRKVTFDSGPAVLPRQQSGKKFPGDESGRQQERRENGEQRGAGFDSAKRKL